MQKLLFSEYTPEERKIWLENPLTEAYLKALNERAADLREACARDLGNGRSEKVATALAGQYVGIDRAIGIATGDNS